MVLAEKYRPIDLDDVKGQPDVVEGVRNLLQRYKNERRLPNLLFVGPYGSGKTSVAQIIARLRYGEDWKNHYRAYDASDKLGVETISELVQFSRFRGSRIIFVDEADRITKQAQEDLRRDTEKSKSTTFIFSFNDPSNIDGAIESRCVRFDFQRLPDDSFLERLIEICKAEGYFNTKFPADAREGLLALVRYADGDMRKGLNTLEKFVTSEGLDYKAMMKL